MLSVVNVLFQCLCYDSSPTVTFSSCRHVCVWPAVLPGWPSMLAKRMSELSVGYISIQADIEWSWPWSWSSSRNFWENNKKRWGSGKYTWPLLLAYIKTVINQIKCEKLHAVHFFLFLFETSILCFCFSPGRPLYSCAAVFFPWEVSFASLPPPPSPEPEYAPQNI